MTQTPRKPPAAVVRGKEMAALIRGRDLLFKARNYMGPVHVDEATCSYRWFKLKMTTRPWREGLHPTTQEWMVPPDAVRVRPQCITLRAYDTVGMLIHDPQGIDEIETLYRSGATVGQLLRAFNDRSFPRPSLDELGSD